MYNQYLLAERVKAEIKAERAARISAETKSDLQKNDLNLDDFVISGNLSLPEVLHPTTTYTQIKKESVKDGDLYYCPALLNEKTGKVELYMAFIDLFELSVQGIHNNNSFKSILNHKDIIFPYESYEKTKAALQTLEKLERHLLQRQAAQPPEYISTYRTNTKIRTPELK